MTLDVRARRSALYLPASNERAIQKARISPCDVVILDLEDAVTPDMKEVARDIAVRAVAEGGFGAREVVVRTNGLDTPWGQADLAQVGGVGPDVILVPKVNDAASVLAYDAALRHSRPDTRLWAMIETAMSIFRLEAIAACAGGTRLSGLVLGTNDLAKETGAELTVDRAPFTSVLGLSVIAARAHGLVVLDGVFNDLEDEEGFATQCRQGRRFGFDGKTVIHPRQIEPCNAAFSPSADEIAWSQAIVDAFERPENRDKGAIRLEGRMVERLHLDRARRTAAGAGFSKAN
jgi:citrate lyase subunit beta/citryl-CoA lyase